jgi:hypothetical protein
MSMPTLPGLMPQPQTPPRGPNGYVQLPGGYDDARGAPQSQAQPQRQYPTQLGQPAQQSQQQQPLFSDSQSPLQGLPPNVGPQSQPVPQLQPQQPLPQSQQPNQIPAQADLNARVIGANIPPELQGRSIGEIIGMVNGLRQVHLQTLQQVPQPQAQPQNNQPGQAQPQIQVQPQNGQPAPQTFDWRRPEESIGRVVGEQINRVIDQRFGPMLQQNQGLASDRARNIAAAELGPSFATLEPMILQRLSGIDPAALSNPETWRVAARVAIGDLMVEQARRVSQQPQTQPQYAQPGQPGIYPTQQTQPGASPLPNLNGFFTESPSQGGPGPQGVQLTPQQRAASAAMGMSEADYSAWLVGVPQQNGGRR